MTIREFSTALVFGAAITLSACGGGGEASSSAPPTFTVSGTVSGLAGTGLVLRNNGAGDLAITQNGKFTVSVAVVSGTPYNVTVLTQPSGPAQTCIIAGDSGTVSAADITDVAVTCTTRTFTIGGTLSGYNGTRITLRNSGGDPLRLNAVSNFTFATPIPDGTGYSVAVFLQPLAQICAVARGSGILHGANVTDVAITCTDTVVVRLLAGNSGMPSSGTTTVDLTALVVDGVGQALAGTPVNFSTGADPSAFISTISGGGNTDANGQVTAKLNLGANKSNRTITITATATQSGASRTNTVGVVGTAITVSGSTSLAFGATTTLTFALKDSAGTPIPGATMTFASQAGNAIAPSSTTTNAAGQIAAVVTATQTAVFDVLTATAAGASLAQSLAISSASFLFTTPAQGIDIPLGAPTPVNIHWTSGGVAQSGQLVTFSTSRGTISGGPGTVNGAGNTPGVSIISNVSAGPAVITAQGQGNPGPAATLNVNFVATTATSVAVQAVPGTVQFTTNAPGQTSNISTITVTVRDGANNLVKNASINFSLTDITGGFLAANTAITDVTGSASVNYTAGSISSAQNGVTITATVDKVNGVAIPILAGAAQLTVAGQALFVRLGTDNLVQTLPAPDPDLQKMWFAIVTDVVGNPVVGVTVRFALRPGRYQKGLYTVVGARWLQTITAICANEDVDFNGILDPGEDFNGNGSLEPGNVATVTADATTDANGIATAFIEYPKDHATWTEVTLEARAGVVGNDPPARATFFLAELVTDYTDVNVPPPGVFSPYGTDASCASSF